MNGKVIEYTYSSDGTRLKARYTTGTSDMLSPVGAVANGGATDIIYNDSIAYCDNFVYRNGKLTEILLPEGYIKITYHPILKRIMPEYFFYVKDHLGNVRMSISEQYLNGEVSYRDYSAQSYYPFGGSMKNWNSYVPKMRLPLNKYNGKEEEQTHNLGWYNYGKRFYDPNYRLGFISIDPLCEKYYSISPYAYCLNNPINAIDPDGRLVIFVNGMHYGFEGASRAYWNTKGEKSIRFDMAVNAYFKDWNNKYYDGSIGGLAGLLIGGFSPFQRARFGYLTGEVDAASIIAGLSRNNKGEITETVKVIAHSMGAAYAKGLIKALVEYAKKKPGLCAGLSISEYDFAPFQPTSQRGVDGVSTFQYSHEGDGVAGKERMRGAKYMDTSSDKDQVHSISSFYDQITSLPAGKYEFVDGEFTKVN